MLAAALLVAACGTQPHRRRVRRHRRRAPQHPPPRPARAPLPRLLPRPPHRPALASPTIKSRGKLICGVNGGLPGFSFLDQGASTWSGFDVDYCKAVAAAVFGNPDAVEFRALSTAERGPALQTGEVDMLVAQHDLDGQPRHRVGPVRSRPRSTTARGSW